MEAAPGFEPGNGGFAVLCLTTWLHRHDRINIIYWEMKLSTAS